MDMKTGAEQPLELLSAAAPGTGIGGKPVQEPIYIRRGRLKSIFNGQGHGNGNGGKNASRGRSGQGQELEELTSDVLLDSFIVLYDEFRTSQENDEYRQFFVNKYAKSFTAVKNNLVNINDFTFGGLIGTGRFGQVRLAREDRSGRTYAVKILEKCDVLVQKHISALDNELSILSQAKSPWLASLKYSFHSPDSLYFVMEYIPGGDFNSVLRLTNGKLSEEFTRFYMAELVLAIESLHSFGYAHRDIRPENILFDRLGHIKLVDFGSSARIAKDGKVTGQFHLGSPTYVAPEILQSLEDDEDKLKLEDLEGKYGPGCDYWSLGVLAFEWMFGRTPFAGDSDIQTFKNIISFQTSFVIPTDFDVSADFIALLKELLTSDADRIGYTKLLRHPFFHTIIWDGIRNEIPPYIPIIKSEDDLSNFQSLSHKKSMVFLPAPVSISTPTKDKLGSSAKALAGAKAFVGFTRTMLETTGGNNTNLAHAGRNTSLNLNKSLHNNSTMNSTWTDNSADSSFFQRDVDSCKNCNSAGQLQTKAELTEKLEALEEKNSKIDSLESKLEILSTLSTEKDTKIASLSSQVKRLQCEKEIALRELDEEREVRQDLEKNATDLVTSIKASQQKKMSELQNEVIIQRKQISDREKQLEDYHELLASLREENIKYKMELDHCFASKSGEKSLKNARQSVRQSISMLETRMNLSTCEWESRIQDLQAKHALEIDSLKTQSQQQESQFLESINRYKCELNDLIGRLEESRHSREATLFELNQLYHDYDLLKKESQQRVNQLIATHTSKVTKAEESFVELESQLEHTKHERDNMSIRIEALVEETQQKEVQIQSLSQVVGRLEQSIASVEKYRSDFQSFFKQSQENMATSAAGAERVLQEQLAKAQDSLERVMAQHSEEMQRCKEFEQKLVGTEKDFTVARMDLKILKREKKELEEKGERLEAEREEVQNTIKLLEAQKIAADTKVEVLEGEIMDLQSKMGASERALKEAMEVIENLKENQKRINREYDDIATELLQNQGKLEDYEQLRVNLDERDKEMREKDDALEEKDRRISMLTSNVQALKDVIAVLEDQLKDLDTIVALNNDETTKFLKTKSTLEIEKARLQDELKSTKTRLEEFQARKSLETRQLSDVSAALRSEESRRENEVTALNDKIDDLKETNEVLSFRIAELEGNLEELGVTKNNLTTTAESLRSENQNLKEESSKLITQIVKTKELNITFKAAIEEAVNKIELYKEIISDKTETISCLEAEKAEIESRFQATFDQHRKILELLQDVRTSTSSCKNDHAHSSRKKKTLFSGRIFGLFEKDSKEDHHHQQQLSQNANLERDLLNLLAELPLPPSTTISSSSPTFEHSSQKSSSTSMPSKTPVNTSVRRNLDFAMLQTPTPTPTPNSKSKPVPRPKPAITPKPLSGRMALVGAGDQLDSPLTSVSKQTGPLLTSTPGSKPTDLSTSSLTSTSKLNPKLHPIVEEELQHEEQLLKRKRFKEAELSKIRELQKNQSHSQNQKRLPRQIAPELEAEPEQDSDNNNVYLDTFPKGSSSTSAVFKTATILEVNTNKFEDANGNVQSRSALQAEPAPVIGEIYCVKEMTRDLYLLGTEGGLFSRKVSDIRRDHCVRIEGVGSVYQLEFIFSDNLVVLIEGEDRRLISIAYGMLEACAKAASCSRPELGFGQEGLANLTGVDAFRVQKKEDRSSSYIAAILEDCIVILDRLRDNWVIRHRQATTQKAPCLLTTPHSIFYSGYSVYVLSYEDLSVDEFIDDRDFDYENIKNQDNDCVPVAILDVGRSNLTQGQTVYRPEYLMCFTDYAIFVDGFGRRSRSECITWTKVPLQLEYCHPNLFVTHFNSIEVLRLDATSYTKTRVIYNRNSIGKEVQSLPEPNFLPLTNPKIVGCGRLASASVILVAQDKSKQIILDVGVQVPLEMFSENSSVFEASLSSDSNSNSGSSSSEGCTGLGHIRDCNRDRGRSTSPPTSIAASGSAVSISDSNDNDTDKDSTATDFSCDALAPSFERGTRGFMGRLPIFAGSKSKGELEASAWTSTPSTGGHSSKVIFQGHVQSHSSIIGRASKSQGTPQSVKPQKPMRIRFSQPLEED